MRLALDVAQANGLRYSQRERDMPIQAGLSRVSRLSWRASGAPAFPMQRQQCLFSHCRIRQAKEAEQLRCVMTIPL